ncbi:MAG TPA: tRNA lysidine(34) synthetase TilS [Sporichthya sp.]|nr:tRNA lysidine(34) synthetase TilS [Sporichthya sp.]
MGPHPAVAAVRLAVRAALADLEPGDLVLVACSGGPDSLALARAVAFEAPKLGVRAGAVSVDHGLQAGSAERAAAVIALLATWGLDPVEAVRVEVATAGGPEAAARDARYAALDEAADRHGACAVLLGHTRDDQAETVLLGLARGSGARSLAGMAPVAGRYRRPLLDLERDRLAEACRAEGLDPWADPHNTDPAYARARVRHEALPALEQALGPGVAAALARTAALLRADADALDAIAAATDCAAAGSGIPSSGSGISSSGSGIPSSSGSGISSSGPGISSSGPGIPSSGPGIPSSGLDCAKLAAQPAAIRSRILRNAAIEAGCPGTDLTAGHVAALDALVTAWRGQSGVDLPGRVQAVRTCGTLELTRRPRPEEVQ